MKMHVAALTLVAVGMAATPALAQDPPPAMMEAMARAGMVNEHHKALHKLAGMWDLQVKAWMDPSGPPMEMGGTLDVKTSMDGRFVEGSVNSEFGGQPFMGRWIMGYNNTTGQYESIWFDNMNTAMPYMTGEANAAHDQFTFHGKYKDPMSGEMVQTRGVMKFLSPTEIHEESYEIRNGRERKTMEIHYRKKM